MSHARGRTAATTVAGVLGVLLLVVISAWAASLGPSGVFTGPGIPHVGPELTPATPESSSTQGAGATQSDTGQLGDLVWLKVLATLLFAGAGLFAAALVFLLARLAWGAWQYRRRRREEAREDVSFEVLDSPALLAHEIERHAARQRSLLAEGLPRNGIVACWHEFEVVAGGIGLARQPWQTAAEFTLQVLELVEADHGAVGRLADLYREARFSEHEVDELHRDAARRALAQIHESLPYRAGAGR